MINIVTVYTCVCDNCGQQWKDPSTGWASFIDKIDFDAMLGDDDNWTDKGTKHYCPDCWSTDQDGNIIIHKQN